MSWSAGSEVARPLIKIIKEEISDKEVRRRIYKVLINTLECQDWDTQYEAINIDNVYDELLKEMTPNWD